MDFNHFVSMLDIDKGSDDPAAYDASEQSELLLGEPHLETKEMGATQISTQKIKKKKHRLTASFDESSFVKANRESRPSESDLEVANRNTNGLLNLARSTNSFDQSDMILDEPVVQYRTGSHSSLIPRPAPVRQRFFSDITNASQYGAIASSHSVGGASHQSYKVRGKATKGNVMTKTFRSSASVKDVESLVYTNKELPTLIQNKARLVSDPNLEEGAFGVLYLAEACYFDVGRTPEYVLSVHPDIYGQVMREVNDSITTPCGLYTCWHRGGDGAHSCDSDNDYVDIRLSVALVTFILSTMMLLTYVIPLMSEVGLYGF